MVKNTGEPILKRSRTATPAVPPAQDETAALRAAAYNAAMSEWESIRKQAYDLAHKSMTAGELGVRLHVVLSRSPSLLSEKVTGYTAPSDEGDGDKRLPMNTELLPLPVPKTKPLAEADIVRMYTGGEASSTQSRRMAAQAWLVLVLTAINTMHDAKAKPSHGPPTEAQAAAIHHLLEDCMDYVSNTAARTPNAPREALGKKQPRHAGRCK